ncbi:hypothetical protein [Clostridium estertheticum]|nr:hypothetical protein [Clostridium estertheticum]
MRLEGCLTAENQFDVYNALKALISQDDESKQRKQQKQTKK